MRGRLEAATAAARCRDAAEVDDRGRRSERCVHAARRSSSHGARGLHAAPEGASAVLEQRARDARRRGAARLGRRRDAGVRHRCSPRARACASPGRTRERGTFSHRHAVLHDVKTGATLHAAAPTSRQAQAPFEVFDSPLSETGVLGFEFGYCLDYPGRAGHLGGAVRRLRQRRAGHHRPVHRRGRGQVAPAVRAVLLLPHGYEGQGPEHSSARLERFLRAVRRGQHPGLLPHHAGADLPPAAPPGAAPVAQAAGRDDAQEPAAPRRRRARRSTIWPTGTLPARHRRPTGEPMPRRSTRLLLCSGKVYYDLLAGRAKTRRRRRRHRPGRAALPVPRRRAGERSSAAIPKLQELVWVQEEPQNMGAWRSCSRGCTTWCPCSAGS